jgi:hypothetical protein
MRLAESIETPRNPPSTPSRSQRSPTLRPSSASKPTLILSSELRAYRQGLPIMLPARRNKVDLSVRTSFDPNHASHLQSHISPRLRAIQRGCIDAEYVTDADQCVSDLILIGFVRGGAEALSSVWQAPHSQECVEQDAEGSSLIHPQYLVYVDKPPYVGPEVFRFRRLCVI